MYLFHLTVRVRPGKEALFIELHQRVSAAIRGAPGFMRRIMLADAEHVGTFFYISTWRSFEDLQAYRESPGCCAWSAQLVASDVLMSESVRVECQLILDEGPRAL